MSNQRPQHLLRRAAEIARVHYWEEALFDEQPKPELLRSRNDDGVLVLTPMLPKGMGEDEAIHAERRLLDEYLAENSIQDFVAWYYTPMALRFSDHLKPLLTVYDCMDELSAFDGAPVELLNEEQKLFARADVVFAGGESLYSVKRLQHRNVHLFPSSIDREHFLSARDEAHVDPTNQSSIPHPRIGFYGVLDGTTGPGTSARVSSGEH